MKREVPIDKEKLKKAKEKAKLQKELKKWQERVAISTEKYEEALEIWNRPRIQEALANLKKE